MKELLIKHWGFLMISAFLVLHETEEIFSLDESEWSNAIRYNIII